MGMPVKLSDELVRVARREAGAADRSITGQIEHWAKLGRAVESLLTSKDAAGLKTLTGQAPQAVRERQIIKLLDAFSVRSERTPALEKIHASGNPVYGTDPAYPGRIVRIDPDGTRTPGRFVKRRFVPAAKAVNR